MAETEIPNGAYPATTVNGNGVNGHGPGYDGLTSVNGHANPPDKKPVTLAIVGAGQRGQVSPHLHSRRAKCKERADSSDLRELRARTPRDCQSGRGG